jgi:HEAT repeat protein
MVSTRLLLPVLLISLTVRTGLTAGSANAAEHARDILEKALHDKNPDTRKQAAVALSLGGAREPFLSQLQALLDDKDAETRLAAVSSLSELKTKQTTAALRKALNDDVPEVSFAAAKALFGQNDPAGKEALLSVLSGESKVASGFLSKQKREALRMVHTPKTMFMFAMKTGIGFAPVPGLGEGISSMQGILSDPGVSGRAMAALLLGKERDEATRQALREALTDKDASVRAAAVHSLALRNDPALQTDLIPLMEEKKEGVRLRAAAGYLRLQLIRKGRGGPGGASGHKKT